MNFLDSYEVGSTTPVASEPAQSLDEEINQVVGQLSKFWGGFRKQSQTAFEAARKDLTQVVSQAQREIGKLTSEGLGEGQSSSTTSPLAAASQAEAEASDTSSSDQQYPSPFEPATHVDIDSEPTTSRAALPSTSSLFSRLQASLPPTLVSSVQTTVQNQIPHLRNAHARANSISAALSAELHKVQTGEFVARGEEFLREASDFLLEAVRVIPPEEQDQQSAALAWDGTDVWMLPGVGATSGKGKEREHEHSGSRSRRPSGEGLRTGATRAEALLKQLKHDPEVIKADPKADERVREMYAIWIKDEADPNDGGVEAKRWKDAVDAALADESDGAALAATRDALVPSDLTEEVFWKRYFFRVYQVEREEEKRKALLQGTTDTEEDFSWEDDEDEAASPTTTKAVKNITEASRPADESTTPKSPEKAVAQESGITLAPPSEISTPGDASPRRQSSEDSYDVVSSQASHASNNIRAGGAQITEDDEQTKDGDDDDDDDDDDEADSDWE